MKIDLASLTIFSSLFMPALGMIGYQCDRDIIPSELVENAIRGSYKYLYEEQYDKLINFDVEDKINVVLSHQSRFGEDYSFWASHNKWGDLIGVFYRDGTFDRDCYTVPFN
ncbi:CSEP0082 putative effector protein [Blumeria hordei DH14]|uniref:CSEP0082 putative effector protein n=1 Tax=Blumeria graminis f. sp. hordei (strain DH14) TaxID=546991 RepID=N1J9K8_BLUG1|nr:CSEP0082 putative effector protein [Blumeria hordei DH14]